MTTPRQKVQALDWQTPIVNADSGIPSPQFMRLWQSLFQNEDGTNSTATDAQTTAEDAAALAQTAIDALPTKADKVTQVIAGAGLTGGGDLSANRTFDIGGSANIAVAADSIDLTNTTVAAGTYGDATHVPTIVVDAKGRVTGVTLTAISATGVGAVPSSRSIFTGTGLSGGGDLSADRTISLANTTVTPGTYGSATQSAVITVDAQGRLTAASNVTITGGGGGGGGTTPSVVQQKTVANNTGAITLTTTPTPGNIMVAFGTIWQASSTINAAGGWVQILATGNTNPNDTQRIAAKIVTASDTTTQSPFLGVTSGCSITIFETTNAVTLDIFNYGFTPETTATTSTLNMGITTGASLMVGVVNSVASSLTPTITGATAGTMVSGTTTNASPQAGTPWSKTFAAKGSGAVTATYTSSTTHYILAVVLRGG